VPATDGTEGSIIFYKVGYYWTFVGGVADLFITCMIWFILDDEAQSDILKHGRFSYAVLNVVRHVSTDIVDQEEKKEEEQEQEEESYEIAGDLLIGDRMIAQFFD